MTVASYILNQGTNSAFFLKILRKTIKNFSQDSQSPALNLNPNTPE